MSLQRMPVKAEAAMHTLMYHDVIGPGGDDSGFRGKDAGRYKTGGDPFFRHLHALAAALGRAPTLLEDTSPFEQPCQAWALTFDDGGIGALRAADMMDLFDWRGHFFVATDYIGSNFFLNREQIRDLRARGHVVGSHSCSHPKRMADLSPSELMYEWQESVSALEDILGEKVTTASVPGGYYSTAVARAADRAGIRFLFTSEATSRLRIVDRCVVLGRFAIRAGTSAGRAVEFATGDRWRCGLERLTMKLKKAARGLGGSGYEKMRTVILERR